MLAFATTALLATAGGSSDVASSGYEFGQGCSGFPGQVPVVSAQVGGPVAQVLSLGCVGR